MYYYILNPAAGGGAINSIQDRLRTTLTELGIAGEFAKTTGPGDAAKMAANAVTKGYNTIVAVGGDGTVNEVINGITDEKTAVGIIPIGNSNTIADHLGITSWQAAIPVLAARRLTEYGLIAAGQNYFLSTLQLGFETDLDKQTEHPVRNLRGRLSGFKSTWGHAKGFEPLEATIKVDDSYEISCDLFSLTVSNQKFSNPLAENKLVVSLTDKPSKLKMGNYLWQLMKQSSTLEETPTTRMLATRILVDTKPSTGIMIDGKLAGRTPIAIRLTERRIRFITEKPTAALKA